MPKKPACPGVPRVNDPITDQEIAFAHLILSGTMTDRRAAEAVGLNPDTAPYTKSKPRVRAYMIEHRAAVREKLVDQEADLSRRAVEDLRKRNIRRDQILDRLWELATLSPEATRASITGQMKALAMIVAIEGLIPDRRLSKSRTQPAATSPYAQIHDSEWGHNGQPAAAKPPASPAAPATPDPVASRISEPPLAHNAGQLNPFVIPQPGNQVPAATTSFFDLALDTISSLKMPYSAKPAYIPWSR
jgi:hypothetical protein